MTMLDERNALDAMVDEFLAFDPTDPDRCAALQAGFLASVHPDVAAYVQCAVLDRIDPVGHRHYRALEYEPICIPRVKVALALGYRNPIEAEGAGATLPPMCGECPAEQFDKADEFDVLFGGAAGGSKTKSSIMFGIRMMRRYDGLRALLLRETFDELDENVYPELKAIDYAEAIGGQWIAGRRQLDIGNSSMRFRYMADLKDIGRRRGGSYQLLLLDEANQLPPGTRDGFRDRLRSANPDIPVIGIRSTANPGGRSHGELKRDFVTPTDYGAKTIEVKNGETGATYRRRFIPAKATDNPYLGADYYDTVLGAIADPNLRRAMRDGDWDVFAGQFFGEWRHDRHVVPRDAMEISRGWRRFEGIDYGRAAPWCMLRAAVDGDGRAWVYRELYEAGLGETEQARRIKADETAMGDRKATRAGDPAMWAKVNDANSIAQTYAENGVVMVPANNDRTSGWARVHTFLAEGEPCPYHASLGWETCPMLHVLEGTAPNLVRTLPDLPFDRTKVEDLDTNAEDHAADALRYLLMQVTPPRRRHRPLGQLQRDVVASSV